MEALEQRNRTARLRAKNGVVTKTRWFATAAAIFYVFLWGSAFVPSKIGVLASSPMWFLMIRFIVSGIIALSIAYAFGSRFPRSRRTWSMIVLLGILANAVYLGCQYIALRHLSAGMGSIVTSLNPLLLALIAPYLLHESLTPKKIVGLVLGFGGVVAMMAVRAGTGTANPSDVLLSFAGVVGSVASTIVFKRYLVDVDVRMTTALQLIAAGIVVIPFALLEGVPQATWGWPLGLSFVYLVAVMSIGGSLLWFWLLEKGQASRVSAFYFLSPVFGLLVASFFGEALTLRDLGGLTAIALGIAVVQRS